MFPAFPSFASTGSFLEAVNAIANFNGAEGVWVHEKVLCRAMGRVEGLSARSLLTKALKYLRQGYIPADKKKKSQKILIDKATFDKNVDIHVIQHGYVEEFSNIGSLGGKLGGLPSSKHQPRYFYYGKKPFVRSVKEQLEIAKEVMSLPFWKQW